MDGASFVTGSFFGPFGVEASDVGPFVGGGVVSHRVVTRRLREGRRVERGDEYVTKAVVISQVNCCRSCIFEMCAMVVGGFALFRGFAWCI